MRLPLRVAERLRQRMPLDVPLFVRISATDWAEGGWDAEQSVVLARHLKELGVDLIDVSSGGLVPKARIPVGKGYQVPFSRKIRDEAGIMTGAVGLITEPRHADEIVTGGDADLVFLAASCFASRTGHSRLSTNSGRSHRGPRPTDTRSSGEQVGLDGSVGVEARTPGRTIARATGYAWSYASANTGDCPFSSRRQFTNAMASASDRIGADCLILLSA